MIETAYLRNISVVAKFATTARDLFLNITWRKSKEAYRLDTLRKTKNKLAKLKHGSIVAIDQIRSVSKMRLIDSTNKYDVLYGLKLSNASMDAIDKCIMETLTKCS